jgi:hypothetical protein
MAQKTEVISGSAVTSTARASVGTYTVPAGKGGVLTGLEVTIFPTLETVVNSGGLVELVNDAVDWTPFEFYTGGVTCVTAGGANVDAYFLPCHKRLPANSIVTAYYTPQDNQSQKCMITLIWNTSVSFSAGKELFAVAGIGSAITQTTKASDHISFSAIPKQKGGRCKAVQTVVWGTAETVVNSGGLVTIQNKTLGLTEASFYTNSYTVVTEGGCQIKPKTMPYDFPVPELSTFTVDYTPQDNQSQALSMTIFYTKSGN